MTEFEPDAPERAFKLSATVGVYRSGLMHSLDRWAPARHAQGVVAHYYREWGPPADLDFRQALDALIERLVAYRDNINRSAGDSEG
jgi:hypothetical protein